MAIYKYVSVEIGLRYLHIWHMSVRCRLEQSFGNLDPTDCSQSDAAGHRPVWLVGGQIGAASQSRLAVRQTSFGVTARSVALSPTDD